MKIGNILFSTFICIFLCGPAALWIAQDKLHLALPSQITAEEAQYLSGGIEKAEIKANLNLNGFISEKLQNDLETKVGNYIPAKSNVLLNNAKLQRTLIEKSNMLFNWACYPTFYGSDYVFSPTQNRITPKAQSESNERSDGLVQFASHLKIFANAHPDKRFIVFLTPGLQTALYNDSEQYTSNPITYSETVDILDNALGNVSNIDLLHMSYPDEQSYLADYYHFDHHWNYRGAYKSYAQICETLNIPVDRTSNIKPVDAVLYSGSYARESLFEKAESFLGIENSLDPLYCQLSTGEIISIGAHAPYWLSPEIEKKYNAYGLYTGYMENGYIVSNNGDTNMLLIADSFGDSLQNLLPLSCKTLKQSNSLMATSHDQPSLETLTNWDEMDAIVFVGHPDNYSTFVERNPNSLANL